ncbi:MAG: ion transporter [Bacteroidales bacterium]
MKQKDYKNIRKWRKRTYDIIFKSDSFYGKLFDELLLVVILLSVGVVLLESVSEFREKHGNVLNFLECGFTLLFLAEYILRIYSCPVPRKYVLSFFGFIDLLAILPTFIAIIIPTVQPLIVIRALRLLRIYRILKLYRFIQESNYLLIALKSSFRKIFIFMMFIMVLVLLLGSVMYVVEGGENGFYSIPLSIYWAVITLTTVGYGDMVPLTDLGKFISTFIMLLGYSIIAIPTGIVSAEISRGKSDRLRTKVCKYCNESEHQKDARFCKNCGELME